jgi:hypothetical protein
MMEAQFLLEKNLKTESINVNPPLQAPLSSASSKRIFTRHGQH